MTKLNQIVAVEKGVKTTVNRDVTALYHLIEKAPLLTGISRTYRPKDDDGDQLPPESTLVQVKIPLVLEDIARHWTRLIDITATKDAGNTAAKADVVVDGTVLATGLPVPTLLFLEKTFTDLQTILRATPTLDPAETWEYDGNAGVYRTPVIQTNKTKKVPRSFVKAPATDKHAAQVEMFFEDVNIGTWDTVKLSGAIPADRRAEIVERVTALIAAIKFAREEANGTTVENTAIGAELFDYVLAAAST